MDGCELARRIAQSGIGCRQIAITGYGYGYERDRALEARFAVVFKCFGLLRRFAGLRGLSAGAFSGSLSSAAGDFALRPMSVSAPTAASAPTATFAISDMVMPPSALRGTSR